MSCGIADLAPWLMIAFFFGAWAVFGVFLWVGPLLTKGKEQPK